MDNQDYKFYQEVRDGLGLTRTNPLASDNFITTDRVDEIMGEELPVLASDYQQTIDQLREAVRELRGALDGLANAKALSGVQELVLGWNGPNGDYNRHPSRLGAHIKTNCGRIYDLFELLACAHQALAKTEKWGV